MNKKNALAFWYNLKGNYDVVVFDNKRNLNKFAKEYKQLYNECFVDNKISVHEFDYCTTILAQQFDENIINYANEIFSRDIKEDETYNKYIIENIENKETKIIICEFLEYGF